MASFHDEMNAVFDRLIDRLENYDETMETADADAAGRVVAMNAEALVVLKVIHRQLFNDIQRAEAERHRKISLLQKRQRGIDALLYEKCQLEQRIRALENFSTPSLLRLATQQHEHAGDDDESAMNGGEMDVDEVDLLRSYFGGKEISNPADRDSILRRLHDEINGRGKLEQAVKTRKEQLGNLLKELKSVTQLLTSLPQQVNAIERASMHLQRTFAPFTPLAGSERKARLELAQALPPPLYTLYRQLQLHIDFQQDNYDTGSGGGDDDSRVREDVSLPTLGIENSRVALYVPVADPSALSNQSASSSRVTSSGKRLTIHFAYDDSLKVVAAVATGCGALLYQDVVLQGLFPGDEELGGGETGRTNKPLPYRWCNYLAGLHLAQLRNDEPSLLSTFPGTQVIVRELRRRIRANAVLKHILQLLQRGALPSLPASVSSTLFTAGIVSLAQCKVSDFQAHENVDGHTILSEYSMTLSSAGKGLNASVRINKAKYPSEPPVWSLSFVKARMDADIPNEPQLFDASLADMERRVNVWLIDKLSSIPSTSEDSFEWVLATQVRHILALLAQEGSGPVSTSLGKKRKSSSD